MPRFVYFCFLGASILPGSFFLSAADQLPDPGTSSYLLSPFDRLAISVYGQTELGSDQRVSDKGTVSIPLLGEIPIGGLTVSEAQRAIEKAFIEQRYLVKPVVTISIEEFSPKLVTVLGEVSEPGSIAIPEGRNGLPIQVAIAQAGGFTGAAQKNAVQVKRAEGKNEDRKAPMVVVDVGEILVSNSRGNGFMAGPDDIIFVPRRLF